MHASLVSVLGLTAEAFIIVAQIPQIYKSFKTKSTDDISLPMLISVLIGLSLWIVYGSVKPDRVIVIANAVSVVAFGFVIYAKLKYSK
jgi:MtN3 and saliva related transmembrane protein